MIQLHKRHTASHLKDEILKCLKSFCIDISQIYSNTTDNGSNVIKVSKILQELQEEYITEELHLTDSTSVNRDEENIHKTLASVLSVVRCAAHTIQLAAHNVLNTVETNINECRSAAKRLRTLVRAGGNNIQMPILDNATRWNSTYDMLKSLLKIKDFVENENFEAGDNMPDLNWEFINDFVTAFRPLAMCTKKLQCEQYVIGDFYRDWLTCELELEDLVATTPYSRLLYNAMESRKVKLLENDAFLAALYLDPRFNFENSVMLTENHKTTAINHLVKTYEIIKKLEGAEELSSSSSQFSSNTDQRIECENITTVTMADVPGTSRDSYSRLEQRMNQMMAGATTAVEKQKTLKQKLGMLANWKKVPLGTNILQYWKTFSYDSDIKKLVQVALVVPATQVSVERAFSALSVILTKLRTKMSNKTINNILLTKLNFPLLQMKNIDLNYFEEENNVVQI